jgi:peptidyl-prolyl cis-trans isomerase A (cyclophilin A)
VKSLILLIASASLALAQPPAPAKTAAPPKKAAATPAKTGAPAAKTASSGSSRLMNPASLNAKAPEVYRAKFTATKGDFVVEVTRAWAPLGADRFYNLVKNGFYNNAPFFRVVPNFIVQFGLAANPAVSNAWKDANLKDDPVKQGNKKGTITFATAGPGTRTTQVFISLKDNDFLDGQGFSPFGTVTEGMDIVASLYSGYGENGPDQGRLTAEGKPYVDKNFPKIDSIRTATIIFPEAPAAPAKKAAAPGGAAKKSGAPAAAPKTSPPPAPPKK